MPSAKSNEAQRHEQVKRDLFYAWESCFACKGVDSQHDEQCRIKHNISKEG